MLIDNTFIIKEIIIMTFSEDLTRRIFLEGGKSVRFLALVIDLVRETK